MRVHIRQVPLSSFCSPDVDVFFNLHAFNSSVHSSFDFLVPKLSILPKLPDQDPSQPWFDYGERRNEDEISNEEIKCSPQLWSCGRVCRKVPPSFGGVCLTSFEGVLARGEIRYEGIGALRASRPNHSHNVLYPFPPTDCESSLVFRGISTQTPNGSPSSTIHVYHSENLRGHHQNGYQREHSPSVGSSCRIRTTVLSRVKV